VADILHVPHSDLEVAASSVAAAAPVVDGEGEKEARLLVMSAMTQGNDQTKLETLFTIL
jgi:hypothetical protein